MIYFSLLPDIPLLQPAMFSNVPVINHRPPHPPSSINDLHYIIYCIYTCVTYFNSIIIHQISKHYQIYHLVLVGHCRSTTLLTLIKTFDDSPITGYFLLIVSIYHCILQISGSDSCQLGTVALNLQHRSRNSQLRNVPTQMTCELKIELSPYHCLINNNNVIFCNGFKQVPRY